MMVVPEWLWTRTFFLTSPETSGPRWLCVERTQTYFVYYLVIRYLDTNKPLRTSKQYIFHETMIFTNFFETLTFIEVLDIIQLKSSVVIYEHLYSVRFRHIVSACTSLTNLNNVLIFHSSHIKSDISSVIPNTTYLKRIALNPIPHISNLILHNITKTQYT